MRNRLESPKGPGNHASSIPTPRNRRPAAQAGASLPPPFVILPGVSDGILLRNLQYRSPCEYEKRTLTA